MAWPLEVSNSPGPSPSVGLMRKTREPCYQTTAVRESRCPLHLTEEELGMSPGHAGIRMEPVTPIPHASTGEIMPC